MSKNRRAFALALLGFIGTHAYAADETGRFVTGGGVGEESCVTFVAAMESARRYKYHSIEYWAKITSYVSYASGFQTGVNLEWQGRQDVFDGLTIDDVLAKLEGICRDRPSLKYFGALYVLSSSRK